MFQHKIVFSIQLSSIYINDSNPFAQRFCPSVINVMGQRKHLAIGFMIDPVGLFIKLVFWKASCLVAAYERQKIQQLSRKPLVPFTRDNNFSIKARRTVVGDSFNGSKSARIASTKFEVGFTILECPNKYLTGCDSLLPSSATDHTNTSAAPSKRKRKSLCCLRWNCKVVRTACRQCSMATS